MTDTTNPAPVLRAATVAVPPERAFAVFTEEIGAWWPLPTHGVYGERSGGLRFHDSHLVELSVSGEQTVWGEVLAWEPPGRLEISWHPGAAPDGPAGRVEITFTADGTGTRVEVRHDGWVHFGEQASQRRRPYVGPGAWGHVLDHFADGTEPRGAVEGLDDLVAAYDTFHAAAASGGFGPATDGEWSAPQVIAHVALNDLAMAAVAQAIVHGGTPSFDNRGSQDPAHLAAVVAACGDDAQLLAFGRHAARIAVAALARLGADQAQQLVHCRLESDGQVRLDEPRPWSVIASTIQADMHLPAHTEQLQALRH